MTPSSSGCQTPAVRSQLHLTGTKLDFDLCTSFTVKVSSSCRSSNSCQMDKCLKFITDDGDFSASCLINMSEGVPDRSPPPLPPGSAQGSLLSLLTSLQQAHTHLIEMRHKLQQTLGFSSIPVCPSSACIPDVKQMFQHVPTDDDLATGPSPHHHLH